MVGVKKEKANKQEGELKPNSRREEGGFIRRKMMIEKKKREERSERGGGEGERWWWRVWVYYFACGQRENGEFVQGLSLFLPCTCPLIGQCTKLNEKITDRSTTTNPFL